MFAFTGVYSELVGSSS